MADDVITPETQTPNEPVATTEASAATAETPTLDSGGLLTDAVAADVGTPADGENPGGEQPAEGAPETYELALPEGVKLDAEAMTLAEPVLRDLNLSNEQASKLAAIVPTLASHYAKQAQDATITEVIEMRKAWATEAMADPKFGGANLDRSRAHAAKFMDYMAEQGYPNLRQTLDESGYTNHPAFLAAFAMAGEMRAEDSDFSRGTPVKTEVSRVDRYYSPAS